MDSTAFGPDLGFLETIDDRIESAKEEIKLLKSQKKKTHWEEYLDTLEKIKKKILEFESDMGDLADAPFMLNVILRMSKDSKPKYVVAANDRMIEFASGAAEAYRESTQTLMQRIEIAIKTGVGLQLDYDQNVKAITEKTKTRDKQSRLF